MQGCCGEFEGLLDRATGISTVCCCQSVRGWSVVRNAIATKILVSVLGQDTEKIDYQGRLTMDEASVLSGPLPPIFAFYVYFHSSKVPT